jgi:hypothetical protein
VQSTCLKVNEADLSHFRCVSCIHVKCMKYHNMFNKVQRYLLLSHP